MVDSDDEEVLILQVAADCAYQQTVQCEFDEADEGGLYAAPVEAYIPESRLLYQGECWIETIEPGATGTVVVHFEVSGDDAEKAVLWRLGTSGLELVCEVEQLYSEGFDYTLEDLDPALGSVSYRVQTGVRTSAYLSDAVESE